MIHEFLSIREKRLWLAEIFRNETGEYTQADKFKALVEDTKLAAIQQEEEELSPEKRKTDKDSLLQLLSTLPPPDPVYQPQSSRDKLFRETESNATPRIKYSLS